MAETVRGGVYRDASGDGYHDANGKPVTGNVVEEARLIQEEQSQRNLATLTPIPSQSTEALAAAMRSLIVPQAQPQVTAPPEVSKPLPSSGQFNVDFEAEEAEREAANEPASAPKSSSTDLVAETERRGRRKD